MNCELYRKQTTWDFLTSISVRIRKNGKLLALKEKKEKPKQEKEIQKRTKTRKDPENIIIQVGNNDVNSKEPRLTAEGIVNLALQIEGDTPHTMIAILGLVSGADNKEGKFLSVNKILKNFCHQNDCNSIEHNNVSRTHLNLGGLRLSKSGTALLVENFCKYID